MTEAMIRALVALLEAEIAGLLPAAQATEAGRVFSAANEAQLRAIVTSLNALLAQVSAPPDPTQQIPAASASPAAAPAAVAMPAHQIPPQFVRQSIGAPEETIIQEGAIGATPIAEAAKNKGLIRVITPGWGSSGYYSEAVLARDAPTAFPRGTKMYWDHPTEAEAKARPEGSLTNLAAETTEPAVFLRDGPEGPGVYARNRVFAAYQPAVEDLKDNIGVSIRAAAFTRQGEAEGRKGTMVEKLLPAMTNSIDFVTIPGRGGRVSALFESARGANTTSTEDDMSEAELREARTALAAAQAENARMALALAMEAAVKVATEAAGSVDLPDVARERIIKAATANPPMKEGALDREALTASVKEAATAERRYLDGILGTGTVRGMGSGTPNGGSPDPAIEAALTAGFRRFGLSESGAKIAGSGR